MKQTFIYRIELGRNGRAYRTKYCYARNAKTAEKYYREKYHEEKYDMFKAVVFGEADILKHPGPFEELPDDEVKYILANQIGSEDAYAYRKNVLPPEFVPVSEET